MRHHVILPLALAAASLVATRGEAQRTERFTLDGSRVAVYNLAGEVRVEPGSGSQVVVEVTRGGSDAAELRVREGETDGAASLVVQYPGDRIVYPRMGRGSNTEMTVESDGTFGGPGRILGGRRVRLQGTGSGTEAWADLRVLVPAGRTVSVSQGVGRVDVANVRGDLRVKTAAAAIRAQGTRGALNLDTGSGGIEVRDARGEGDRDEMLFDTGSGGVRLFNVGARRLTVDTGSGGVDGSNVEADELHVDVGSGGVDLEGVDAKDIVIDTGSGSVELSLRGDVQRARIDTGSGGVTLAVPANFGAELDIDTGSGGIDVDVPATVRRAGRSHFTGTIGDGNGRVEIDTGSGGVRVRRI
jgi:lia operon protein LiaG